MSSLLMITWLLGALDINETIMFLCRAFSSDQEHVREDNSQEKITTKGKPQAVTTKNILYGANVFLFTYLASSTKNFKSLFPHMMENLGLESVSRHDSEIH